MTNLLSRPADSSESIPIFDTHAHLDFPQFQTDPASLLRRLKAGIFPGGLVPDELENVLAGQKIEIVGVVVPGVDTQRIDADVTKRIHESFAGLAYLAVGIHPNYTANISREDWQIIAELAHRDDVIAIGETGIDRHWDESPLDIQIDFFRRHIELSQKTNKPILIHCRDAWDDVLPLLREIYQQSGPIGGAMHAFSGNTEQMLACVELGLHVSFAGSLTYRNAKFSALWEAARNAPADRLLIETDAPFMLPHPYRGKLPQNEPTLAALTALRLAELRSESLLTVAKTTANNAFRLFGLQ